MRWLIAVLVLATSTARADDPEAQRLLDEGTRLFTEDANHEAARASFQQSYDKEPSWRALNGIALTYQEQGRFIDALVTYEKLLADFDAVLTDSQRATVKSRSASLDAKIGVVEISTAQTATVSIDSDELGVGPLTKPVRLLPGRHVVIAKLAGYQTLTKTIDVVAGQRGKVDLVLAPERVVVKVEPVRLERRFPTWMPFTVLGTGAAIAITGGVLHLLSGRDFRAFDDSVEDSTGFPPRPVDGDPSLRDRAVVERRLAIAGYITGGLALIAGGVLYASNTPRPVDVVPAGRGVALRVRF